MNSEGVFSGRLPFIFKINKRKSVKVFDGKYGRLFLNLNFNAWFSEIDWNPHFLEIK